MLIIYNYAITRAYHGHKEKIPWSRRNMETFYLVGGIHRSLWDSTHKGPLMRSVDVALSLTQDASVLSSCRWFKAPWRIGDVTVMAPEVDVF